MQIVHVLFSIFQPNFKSIIDSCNLWRNFDDIQDSWASLESIIDYYGNNQDAIVPNAGPGHFNDPDMVGLSIINISNNINLNCLYLNLFHYNYTSIIDGYIYIFNNFEYIHDIYT